MYAVLTRLPAGGYSLVLLVVTLIGAGTAGTAFGSVVLAATAVAWHAAHPARSHPRARVAG